MVVADDARLDRCGAAIRRDDPLRGKAVTGCQLAQLMASRVISDHAKKRSCCTKGVDVCRHVGSAAKVIGLSTEIDYRHRGFGANARDVTPVVVIKHHIAQHSHLHRCGG